MAGSRCPGVWTPGSFSDAGTHKFTRGRAYLSAQVCFSVRLLSSLPCVSEHAHAPASTSSGNGIQDIAIPGFHHQCHLHFKAVKKRQAAERLRAGTEWQGQHVMVLTTEVGTMVDPRNLLRVVEVAARSAGLANVGAHTLRHSRRLHGSRAESTSSPLRICSGMTPSRSRETYVATRRKSGRVTRLVPSQRCRSEGRKQ